ncbi:GNAT family N-acetyltransferase [Clostridium tagluense]|uniref:GNAT family N-acetyltransferase n=1 Tax=Clostridium tagluense TaxID=360422 RepID=UPI001CF58320|nr:GNAT family N-acetyltransferase [Clostridium tagluense]MCB2297885.1 GNAT family N-acetyltransferase [Clostridium tagluense]
MQKKDINKAIKIWTNQYKIYCGNNNNFPTYWGNNINELESFLNNKVANNNAIVAKLDKEIVGFLAYDEFPFNGEDSVFCPAIGHCATEDYKEIAYLSLYKNISQQWINKGILNHMWTIFYNDTELKNILFDLGYGSYLIDAFSGLNIKPDSECLFEIKRASSEDINTLYELVEESKEYYQSAPLFLTRDRILKEEISEIISKNNVFIAWDKELAVGFINLSISKNNNPIDMTAYNCGLIDEIGAYIKLEYRGKKVGTQLLKRISEYCNSNNISCIHVDFETANLYANKFWRKYFNPMLLSMRRSINKNINDK